LVNLIPVGHNRIPPFRPFPSFVPVVGCPLTSVVGLVGWLVGLKFNAPPPMVGESGLKAFARRRRLAKAEVIEKSKEAVRQ